MSDTEPEKRQIQVKGRVDIPDDMLNSLGLDREDNVVVYEEDGKIVIQEFSMDLIK
jgi:bifunctional DNA-binding transcriptional regulator/antitoxin component of YhaV-PrlF toxin-antitoxin module